MGIPKKGSRTIMIEGHEYRYVVSGNDGTIDLIVESNQSAGQKLIVSFDYTPKVYGFNLSHTNQMTPEIVRKTIIYSLRNNWKPISKNKVLRLNLCGREELIKVNKLE
tara:strand:+ start:103 stop:426 length:324 start_codon:yes stop_codon:yes gene_type:complete